jgi:transmembrane sensor
MSSSQDPSTEKLDQAIVWHVRLNSEQADERMWIAFSAWLQADDDNRAAFDRVEDLSADLNAIAGSLPREEAELERPRSTLSAARIGRYPYRWLGAGAALAAALALIYILPLRYGGPAAAEYVTGVGQSRTVSLPDGSVVDLNTDTKIRVLGGDKERRVALVRGEALFHVARDVSRPFRVAVGAHEVRDLGTVFDVLRDGGSIVVTVAEGKVGFATHASQARPDVELSPGNRLSFREAERTLNVRHVSSTAALAWRSGYLIYENAPLTEVVSDINRYFVAKIVIGDSRAASQHFSGVLRIDRQSAILETLSHLLPVEAHRRSDGQIVLQTAKDRD